MMSIAIPHVVPQPSIVETALLASLVTEHAVYARQNGHAHFSFHGFDLDANRVQRDTVLLSLSCNGLMIDRYLTRMEECV